jgi:hypothetical protein
MKFDETMLKALTRTSAPEGFAERVLTRLDHTITPPAHQFSSTLRRLAAAVVLTAALGGLTAHQVIEHRRNEGERARREVMTALHIASAKMRAAQHAIAHD